jgi:hypothetical protein
MKAIWRKLSGAGNRESNENSISMAIMKKAAVKAESNQCNWPAQRK